MFTEFCGAGPLRVQNTIAQEIFIYVIPNGIWIMLKIKQNLLVYCRLQYQCHLKNKLTKAAYLHYNGTVVQTMKYM
jgi:hypothetical protein